MEITTVNYAEVVFMDTYNYGDTEYAIEDAVSKIQKDELKVYTFEVSPNLDIKDIKDLKNNIGVVVTASNSIKLVIILNAYSRDIMEVTYRNNKINNIGDRLLIDLLPNLGQKYLKPRLKEIKIKDLRERAYKTIEEEKLKLLIKGKPDLEKLFEEIEELS